VLEYSTQELLIIKGFIEKHRIYALPEQALKIII